MAHARLNNIFNDMKHRCYNPKDKCYKDYGARGITVCAEWNNRDRVSTQHNATKGFITFKKWALEVTSNVLDPSRIKGISLKQAPNVVEE